MKFKVGDRIVWINPDFPRDHSRYLKYKNKIGIITNFFNPNSYQIRMKIDNKLWRANESNLKLYKPKLKKFLEEFKKEK